MPPKVAGPAGQQTRSRTGCQTCRQRKLKCDEVRPTCTQCSKSNRVCVPSEGIAWRHQQNAGAGDQERAGLNHFYRDTPKFKPEQMRQFLPVARELTWVSVNSGVEGSTPSPRETTPSGTQAQQVAAHSLAALSTAADISYSPQPQHAAYYTTNPPSASHPEYGFVQAENVGNGVNHAGNNIHFMLNPSQAQTETPINPLIDPLLEASVAQAVEEAGEVDGMEDTKLDAPENEMTDAEAETHIAMALRNFNKTPS